MPLSARLLLLLVLLVPAANAHDWFRQVTINTVAAISCHDPLLFPFSLLNDTSSTAEDGLPEEISEIKWLLPGETELKERSPPAGVTVEDSLQTLLVNATKANQGVYYCGAFFNNTQWYYLKRGVNPHGPLISDPMAVYRQSIINGFASAGAFLLIAGILALVYTFRWESRVGASYGDDSYYKAEESTSL